MKKLFCITLYFFLCQKFLAQPPCTTTPGAATVVPVLSTICTGETVSLSINNLPSGSGVIYKWQYSNVSAAGPYTNITGVGTPTYETGPSSVTLWYLAIITCANGGSATTTSPAKVVIDNCTGIGKQNNVLKDVIVYPNPVERTMTVEISESAENVVFRMCSTDGREVTCVYKELNEGKTEMDMSSLETGLYFLEITSQNQSTRKVICVAH